MCGVCVHGGDVHTNLVYIMLYMMGLFKILGKWVNEVHVTLLHAFFIVVIDCLRQMLLGSLVMLSESFSKTCQPLTK